MQDINLDFYKFKKLEYIIGAFNGKLCLVDSVSGKNQEKVKMRLKKFLGAKFKTTKDEVLEKTKKQLEEYFLKKRQDFDIPLLLLGTDFQKKSWQEMQKIPFGRTIDYKTQAKNIGNIKAYRSVANANSVNAISIIIPCHRVIGANGKLTGYAGGLELKKKLLNHEQK